LIITLLSHFIGAYKTDYNHWLFIIQIIILLIGLLIIHPFIINKIFFLKKEIKQENIKNNIHLKEYP
ncbi:MAG: UPF0104 family protein, partial [cyanobacterium endosymbiont of Rhopalodia fuxianensis]